MFKPMASMGATTIIGAFVIGTGWGLLIFFVYLINYKPIVALVLIGLLLSYAVGKAIKESMK